LNISHSDLSVQVCTGDDDTLWVELRGEADVATHDHLRASLAQIPLDGKGAVHLRVRGLTFCDTRAFCLIVAFAARVHQRGRRLTTHGASDALRKISAVLCADGRLNLA
jgi:anti-anti-sigma regulatory factor